MRVEVPTEHYLGFLLRTNKIDLKAWGKDKAKPAPSLYKELREKDCGLEYIGKGELRRRVDPITVEVYYIDEGRQLWRLKEEKQEFGDGRVRVRPYWGVSEKRKDGEDLNEAARRAMKEELGIDNVAPVSLERNEEEDVRSSQSYPGLKTLYKTYPFEVYLKPGQFKPEGYQETRDGITTYFVWKKIGEK